MTEMFTFRDEVLSHYDLEVYELFMETFDQLPISALIASKYLAMHGGISPDLQFLDQLDTVQRFREIPLEGMMCDLMWADPMKDEDANHGDWELND